MKYCLLLLLFLFFFLSVSCASVTSGSNLTPAVVEKPSVSLTPASPDPAATLTPAPTFIPTHTPPPTPTVAHTPPAGTFFTPASTLMLNLPATPASIVTPIPLPSASFTPANTPALALTSTPIPLPRATLAPVETPTLALTTRPLSANSPTTPAQVERGFEVYKQQYCGLCHQLDAAGTAGQFGPSHNGIGTRAEQRIHEAMYTGAAATAAEYVHESIVSPQVYVVAGYENTQHRMPAYTHLSEADVDALVQMLLQQK